MLKNKRKNKELLWLAEQLGVPVKPCASDGQLSGAIFAATKRTRPAWTPFEKAVSNLPHELTAISVGTGQIWLNNRYQVIVREIPTDMLDASEAGWPEMIWLSIKDRDNTAAHDWRDFQRIKNELVGPENEAVEVYPAESRLVDTSNQFHLWVFKDASVRLPFGFRVRLVMDADAIAKTGLGAKQRAMEDET